MFSVNLTKLCVKLIGKNNSSIISHMVMILNGNFRRRQNFTWRTTLVSTWYPLHFCTYTAYCVKTKFVHTKELCWTTYFIVYGCHFPFLISEDMHSFLKNFWAATSYEAHPPEALVNNIGWLSGTQYSPDHINPSADSYKWHLHTGAVSRLLTHTGGSHILWLSVWKHL